MARRHSGELPHVPEELLVRRGPARGDRADAVRADDLQRAHGLLADGGRGTRRLRGPLLPPPDAVEKGRDRGRPAALPLSRARIRPHGRLRARAGTDDGAAGRAGTRLPGGREIQLDLGLARRPGGGGRGSDNPLPVARQRGLGRQGRLFPSQRRLPPRDRQSPGPVAPRLRARHHDRQFGDRRGRQYPDDQDGRDGDRRALDGRPPGAADLPDDDGLGRRFHRRPLGDQRIPPALGRAPAGRRGAGTRRAAGISGSRPSIIPSPRAGSPSATSTSSRPRPRPAATISGRTPATSSRSPRNAPSSTSAR